MRLIKQLLVLTIIFSIILTFILLPIRYEYEYMAPLSKSRYNLFVNGLITKSDYVQLIKDPNIINTAAASYGSGNVYKGEANKEFVETVIPVDILILNNDTINNASKLDIINLKNFLIRGELKSGYNNDRDEYYALLSWDIAKKLDADIGDTVTYWVADSKFEYKVSGITEPTSETEFVIELSPKLDEYLRSFGPITKEAYAGNLYILSKDQNATLGYIQSYISKNGKDWNIRTIEELKNSASINVKDSLPPIMRFGLVIGGMLVYLVILLREQNIVIDYKKRNFSILTALGATKSELMRIYSIEQIFVMVMVTFLAAPVSKFVIYQNLFTLYMPISVLVYGVGIGLALNIIAVTVALFYTKRKLNKVPVAELLRKEY